MAGILHKRTITNTPVHPKGRSTYMRSTYGTLCGVTPSMLGEDDLITPYDEDVTCPDCLAILGGRRQGNKDIMTKAKEAEEYHAQHQFDKYSR